MKKLFAVILSLGLILSPMPALAERQNQSQGAAGYAKQIVGIANGIMGAAILTKCKLGASQLSILAYMAGGLTYVAGEFMGGRAQSKAQKENAERLERVQSTMKEGGDLQKGIIDAQIENERNNLEVVQKRRKWMMATKVMYGIATALAILEIWWSFSPPVGIGKPYEGACTGGTPTHKAIEKGIIMAYSSLQMAGGSLKGMAMNMAMGALAKFVLKIEVADTIADKAIGILSSAPGRIAFFAISTGLVMMIDGGLKKEEEEIKLRIADLEKVKAQFEAADNNIAEGESTTGAGNTSGSLGGNENDPSKRTYNVAALNKGIPLAKSCFSNAGGNLDYSESGCKSPLRINRPSFGSELNIPTLANGLNSSIDMANAVASGDIASADTQAANLGSMAGRIDALNKNLMKKLNDQLKKEGKKPIDINAEAKRQMAAYNDAFNKASPGSGTLAMSDFGIGEAAVSENIANAADTAVPEITTAAAPVAPPIDGGIDLSKVESELGDVVDPNAAAPEKVASLEDSLGQYESNENDISKDPGVSIFKQLSNRYILNYEKIFQRKQIDPPLAEPQP